MPSTTRSRKKSEGKKSSTQDFLASSSARTPTSEEEFIDNAALGIEGLARQILSMGVETAFQPPQVTSHVKEEISQLPMSQQIWFVDCTRNGDADQRTLMDAMVYLVDKEKGSNGKPLPESDGLSFHIASAAQMNTSDSVLEEFPLLLGAVVKACLEPGNMMQAVMPPKGTCKTSFPSQRPKRVLFKSWGTMEHLRFHLEEMGITNLGVAECALIQSARSCQQSADAPNQELNLLNTDVNDPQAFRGATADLLLAQSQGPYVSEERVDLNGWRPPEPAGAVPNNWFAQPPAYSGVYRLNALWGWRTNLECAVFLTDVEKIQEICSQRDAQQVREFCEIRILLTKAAEKGLLRSCRALLDLCHVSTEGVQASPERWRPIQRAAGDKTGTTPLHRAAFEGYAEVVKLLLDYGASVEAIDEQLRGTALYHAISQGHLDCIRILCERGSDLSYFSPSGGEALDISEMMGTQGGSHVRLQAKVGQILREYDPRCSHCRSREGPFKQCPCHKEKYCDISCQKARWKKHRKFHKQVMSEN